MRSVLPFLKAHYGLLQQSVTVGIALYQRRDWKTEESAQKTALLTVTAKNPYRLAAACAGAVTADVRMVFFIF